MTVFSFHWGIKLTYISYMAKWKSALLLCTQREYQLSERKTWKGFNKIEEYTPSKNIVSSLIFYLLKVEGKEATSADVDVRMLTHILEKKDQTRRARTIKINVKLVTHAAVKRGINVNEATAKLCQYTDVRAPGKLEEYSREVRTQQNGEHFYFKSNYFTSKLQSDDCVQQQEAFAYTHKYGWLWACVCVGGQTML